MTSLTRVIWDLVLTHRFQTLAIRLQETEAQRQTTRVKQRNLIINGGYIHQTE
jgi:hypothetical protein